MNVLRVAGVGLEQHTDAALTAQSLAKRMMLCPSIIFSLAIW